MPGSSDFRSRRRAASLGAALCACAAFFGCGRANTPEETSPPAGGAFELDRPAVARFEVIRGEIARFGAAAPTELLQELRQISRRYPQARGPFSVLHEVYLKRNDYPALLDLHTQIPAAQRDHAAQITIAKILIHLGRYRESLEILRPILAGPDAGAETSRLAAIAEYFSGDHRAAAILLDSTWEQQLAARDPDVLNVRGLVHFSDGNHAAALELLEKSLALDPRSIQAHNSLARIYSAAGKKEKAEFHRAAARRILDENKSAERRQRRLAAMAQLLIQAREAHRYEECERVIARMQPEADNALNAQLFAVLAEIYREQGRLEDAERASRQARGLSEGQP